MLTVALKKTFSLDKNIQKMAQEDFIMLNLMVSTAMEIIVS